MPKHAKPLVAAAIALVLAAGCQQEPATEAGSTEETATVDAAAVRQAIEDGGAAWESAALAGDAAALTALYTEDAIVMPPNTPKSVGSAIQAGFTEMLAAAPFTAIDIVTEGVEVSASGDMAWAHGSYTSTNTVAGVPYEDTGKWANVSENRDGQWLMVVDIWNSDTPLPGMEGTSSP